MLFMNQFAKKFIFMVVYYKYMYIKLKYIFIHIMLMFIDYFPVLKIVVMEEISFVI